MQKSQTFNELLGQISQYKAQLLAMCNVTAGTDTKSAIEQVGQITGNAASPIQSQESAQNIPTDDKKESK
jgi:hypothetical protein